MREQYPLEVVSGHLVVDINGTRAILDTGSPMSFGRGPLAILGRSVDLGEAPPTASPGELSNKLGTRIDALVGLDVLRVRYFGVETTAGRCIFETHASPPAGVRIPLEAFKGVPIVNASIAGAPVRLILDTGAQIGYLDDELLRGHRHLGPRSDFHPPSPAEFTTEAHEVSLEIGEMSMYLVFGTMPPHLKLMIGMMNTNGILGTDLFNGRKAWFALPDGEMFLSELAA